LNWFKRTFFVLIIIFSFLFCKKTEERPCFKSSGKIVNKTVYLGDFTALNLYQNIDYELVRDSLNYIDISCGENLYPFISFSVSDSALTIKNNNKCRFLRGYDKNVIAKIHIRELSNIYYEGTENLFSIDTISANYCTIMVRNSGGNLELKIKSKELYINKTNATGRLLLSGTTNKAKFTNHSFNTFDVTKLIIRDSVNFLNQGFGNMYINTSGIDVLGRIESDGNVFYKGIPALFNVQEFGKGKFLNLE
jgi:hypothetical protein